MLVRINEVNTAVAACFCLGFTHWAAARGGNLLFGNWGMAKFAVHLWLIGVLVNLLVFPRDNRVRIYVMIGLTFCLQPSVCSLGQPLQAISLIAALLAGELVGQVLYQSSLSVYLGQEAEKYALREAMGEAIAHSREVESARREQLVHAARPGISQRFRPSKRRQQEAGTQLSPIRDCQGDENLFE
jgi:hypothetical protein